MRPRLGRRSPPVQSTRPPSKSLDASGGGDRPRTPTATPTRNAIGLKTADGMCSCSRGRPSQVRGVPSSPLKGEGSRNGLIGVRMHDGMTGPMLLITCPYCGARPEIEFRCGGEAHIARPAEPAKVDDVDWAKYLFYLDESRKACTPSAGCMRTAASAGSTRCAIRRATASWRPMPWAWLPPPLTPPHKGEGNSGAAPELRRPLPHRAGGASSTRRGGGTGEGGNHNLCCRGSPHP